MAHFDMPLDELERYTPKVQCPDDLVPFWTRTVREARAAGTGTPELAEVSTGLTAVRVWDVTFPGFGGHPIKAWLLRPASVEVDEPIPAVVEFVGYGGGRGLPHEHLEWAAAGMAHLVMDNRGQGGHWGSGGLTPDPVGRSAGVSGVMTAGIENPEDHYYRRLYTDGVRAVDAVRSLPGVWSDCVAIKGISQGGGCALAVASIFGMLDGLPPAVMANVPFLCHFRRAVELVDTHPYSELTQYLSVRRDPSAERQLWNTLSYLDNVNLVRFARSAALFSVALMDQTCPPSTVYAAFNAWGADTGATAPKQIDVYPYNQHEGGASYRFPAELEWIKSL